MANEQTTQGAAGAGTLADSIVKAGQLQVNIIGSVMKSSLDVFLAVNKLSLDVASRALTVLNQILQGIAAAVAPKK